MENEATTPNYLIIIDDVTESGGLASPAFVVSGHDLSGYGADAADELMAQVLAEELARRMGIIPLPHGPGGEPVPVAEIERDGTGPHQGRTEV